MIREVKKRDGRIVKYNRDKITEAVFKASVSVGETDRVVAEKISEKVEEELFAKFAGKIPGIEDIQDVVEQVLIGEDRAKIAKAYILYREEHSKLRDTKSMIGVEDDIKLSVNAIKVLERRYLRKDENRQIIETPGGMFTRVAHDIAKSDKKYGGSVKGVENDFYDFMTNLEFMPNSPTLMNAGKDLQQLAACFVLPIEDSMESIFDGVKNTALIHQSGGGTGFSFTRLRPKGDVVKSTGGIASGPLSFMKVFNASTEVIKQGGCVVPDTRVSTSKGVVPISNLGPVNARSDSWHPHNPGRIFVETDENPKESDEFYNHGVSPVKYVHTKSGYSIGATPEHRLRVINEHGQYVWKRVGDISVGDWLALKKHSYPKKTSCSLKPFNHRPHHNAKKISIPANFSPELGELIGYFIGDGAVTVNKRGTGRIILTVAQDTPEVAERLCNIAEKLFGLKPATQKKKGDKSVNYFFNSTTLVTWFKHLGVEKKSSSSVELPEMVFRAGIDFAQAFLRGLFTADGTVSKEGYPSLSSTSPRLTEQVQQLLLALGVPSRVSVLTNRKSAFGDKPLVRLRIVTHEGLETFSEDIGFISKSKNERLKLGLKKAWEFNDVIPNQEHTLKAVYNGPGRGCGKQRSSRGANRRLYKDIQHYLPYVAAPRNLSRRRLKGLYEKHAVIRDNQLSWFLVNNQFYDQVSDIREGESLTLDLSIPDNNTYIANGFISHNTRRGANMGILRIDHPDILEFITAKEKLTELNNFNISVGLTEEFMKAVIDDRDYDLRNPRDAKSVKKLSAKFVFELIVSQSWKTGEPGIIFLDRINRDNPTPALGEIESTNPCITGDATVSTSKGLLRMNDIEESYPEGGLEITTDLRVPKIVESGGMLLLAAQKIGVGSNTISKAWCSGVKETFKIVTKSGLELTATGEHRILTTNGWVKLKDIKLGKHRVLLQSDKGCFNKDSNLPFKVINEFKGRNGRTYKHNFPTNWSNELGQVLGWLVGDGWLRDGDGNRRVGFSFGADDLEVFEYLKPIINSMYGRDVREVVRARDVIHLSYHSKYFVDYFRKLGVKPVKTEEKIVPDSILTATEDAVIGFLQGLFTSDGTVMYFAPNQNCYIRLTAKSKKILQGVQLLLLNLGIKSRIYDRSRKGRFGFEYENVDGVKKSYYLDGVLFELNISRDMIPLFLEKIGFLCGRHKNKTKFFEGIGFRKTSFDDEVASIEPVGRKKVYDLTEPETHSFIANGIVIANCGEQPLLPYEACNLGSVNLSKMVFDGKINWDKLKETVHTAIHFLDNVIDRSKYPLPEIDKMVKSNRKVGLGVMGWADMLIQLSVPYNTEEAVSLGEKVMKFITDEARNKSEKLGKKRGSFPSFPESVFAKERKYLRNATVTTIAPTGTISIIANASSGIEPLFAVSYIRNVMDGTELLEVNPLFKDVAKKRGFYSENLMMRIAKEGSIQHIDEIPDDIKKVFVTAHEITPKWHVRMQAAFQKHTDNAVSKTVNFPSDATPEEVEEVFLLAYKLGCKGVTIYRDKSREEQVLNIGSVNRDGEQKEEPKKKKPVGKKADNCPECKGRLVFEEGCAKCPSCGYSVCSV